MARLVNHDYRCFGCVPASAAFLLWFGYRKGVDAPLSGLILTVLASVLMLARAVWMVFVPVFVLLTIVGSIGRIINARRSHQTRI
jgi:hypothetical protein